MSARFELWDTIKSFSGIAVKQFRRGEIAVQRNILNIVGSNPVLTSGILSIEAAKPFRAWPSLPTNSQLRAYVEDVRTLCEENDTAFLQKIELMREVIARDAEESPGVATVQLRAPKKRKRIKRLFE